MNPPVDSGAHAQTSHGETVTLRADALACGTAHGPKTVLAAPLSFWGGYDATRGVIIEAAHPGYGLSLAGTILVMPRAKGSSSSSSVLAEALRNGTGPAGIVLCERDLIIAIGVIVASELYRLAVPLVVVGERDFETVCRVGASIRIDAPHENGSAQVMLTP
jgi:predicted aconitase with swiveling domain